jgi:hypothetical protein
MAESPTSIFNSLLSKLAPGTIPSEDSDKMDYLDFIAEILKPVKLVVWGELALRYLGVPVVPGVSLRLRFNVLMLRISSNS